MVTKVIFAFLVISFLSDAATVKETRHQKGEIAQPTSVHLAYIKIFQGLILSHKGMLPILIAWFFKLATKDFPSVSSDTKDLII